MKALNYDALGALQYDNGVFWMDFESLVAYFRVIHLSWNPEQFHFKQCIHSQWDVKKSKPLSGTDEFSFEYNPQYKLVLQGKGSAWIMLIRHVTDISKRDEDFLTCHVFDGGQRVFYMGDNQPNIVYQGTYYNNPIHRICVNNEQAVNKAFTIVVSQFKQFRNVNYTLRVYSSVPCTMSEIPKRYTYQQRMNGSWTTKTSGGSVNIPATYKNNPQYRVKVHGQSHLIFKLETTMVQYNVHILVCNANGGRISMPTTDIVAASSGNYRPSFCMTKLFAKGTTEKHYTIVVSTFNQGEMGIYCLTVDSSDAQVEIEPI